MVEPNRSPEAADQSDNVRKVLLEACDSKEPQADNALKGLNEVLNQPIASKKPPARKHSWPAWIINQRKAEAAKAAQAEAARMGGTTPTHGADGNDSRPKMREELERDAEFEAQLSAFEEEVAELDDTSPVTHCNQKPVDHSDQVIDEPGSKAVVGSVIASRPGKRTATADADGSIVCAELELEDLVASCERSWRVGAPETSFGMEHAVTVAHDSCDPKAPVIKTDDVADTTVAEADATDFYNAGKMRWTYDAFRAYRRLREVRSLARKLSKRVIGSTWNPHPGIHGEKKFPFFINTLQPSTTKKGCRAFKEEWELSPWISPELIVPIPGLQRPDLPTWSKLPGMRNRSAALREVIAGVRFTSVAFGGHLSSRDWAYTLPGSDVLCLSIDLNEGAAARFLARKNGDIGKSFKRDLLRRMDHRGQDADVSAAAIWTRPDSDKGPAVRVFIMLQKNDSGAAHDVALLERNNRFWRSLERHGVRVSPDTMPLRVLPEDIAAYVGLSEEEVKNRWGEGDYEWTATADVQEFTPETGFASPEEIARRWEHSYKKWARFTSRHGLPAWISHEVIQLIEDYFFFPREHVSVRKKLEADQKKHRYNGWRFRKRDRLALERMKLMELSPGEMHIFRCSPAQFAALAVRDGEVLGEYCDSFHKAGRARDLYELVRREWRAD